MKASIVYDSAYGNTKLVAQAIAEQAERDGYATELLGLREGRPRPLTGDVLFVGGPTHMGKMTRRVSHFLQKVDRDYWSHRPVFAFDTYGPVATAEEDRHKQERWIIPGAAGGIQTLARELGLLVSSNALRCPVTGVRGPLVPEALGMAKAFTHQVLGSGGAPPVTSMVGTGAQREPAAT